jgi:hypothetical protein
MFLYLFLYIDNLVQPFLKVDIDNLVQPFLKVDLILWCMLFK